MGLLHLPIMYMVLIHVINIYIYIHVLGDVSFVQRRSPVVHRLLS